MLVALVVGGVGAMTTGTARFAASSFADTKGRARWSALFRSASKP